MIGMVARVAEFWIITWILKWALRIGLPIMLVLMLMSQCSHHELPEVTRSTLTVTVYPYPLRAHPVIE